MNRDPSATRLLLVEDEPVSATFLIEVLAAAGYRVEHAANVADAVRAGRAGDHALWLVDANLPDGNGAQLLAELRTARPGVPALALTAELFRDRLDALLAAGFLEALQKPIEAQSLCAAVARALGNTPATRPALAEGKLPVWDEAAAMSALGGNRTALESLRRLFLDELPEVLARLARAESAGDAAAIRSELHRLAASAGFVGAARLAQAVRACAAEPLDAARLRQLRDQAADCRQR